MKGIIPLLQEEKADWDTGNSIPLMYRELLNTVEAILYPGT